MRGWVFGKQLGGIQHAKPVAAEDAAVTSVWKVAGSASWWNSSSALPSLFTSTGARLSPATAACAEAVGTGR